MGKGKRLREVKAYTDEEVQKVLKNPRIRKAVDEECRKIECAMVDDLMRQNMAAILYAIRVKFKVGKKKLEEFAEEYDKIISDLRTKYQMWDIDSDIDFCARREIEALGIDVDKYIERTK